MLRRSGSWRWRSGVANQQADGEEPDSPLGAEEGRTLQKGDGPDCDCARGEEGGSRC